MKKNSGQSLIEVLIALAIIMLVILALVQVVTVGLKASDYSKKKTQAATYAEQGMENIRNWRDQNWTVFYKFAVTDYENKKKLLTGTTPSTTDCISTTAANLDNIFTRCVLFRRISTENVTAEVTVSWKEGTTIRVATVSSVLTKW